MIARPKMSQIEWKTVEIGASKGTLPWPRFNISELQNASVPYGSEYRQVVIDVADGDEMDFAYLLGRPDRRSPPPLLPGVPRRATKGCLNFPSI